MRGVVILMIAGFSGSALAAPCGPGDSDYDGLTDVAEDVNGDGDCDDDTDGDGVWDYLDADDDEDGVDTLCEVSAGSNHLAMDSDGDLISDGWEWFNFLDPALPATDYLDRNGGLTGMGCLDPWDRDSDGMINALDVDDDGDTLLTFEEGSADADCDWPTAVVVPDGIPAWLDYDSDNDTIPDGPNEGFGDQDGDFQPDFLDCTVDGCAADSDQDEVGDCLEQAACPPALGICALNPDSDGDGVLDGVEWGADLQNPLDTDGDGRLDPHDDDDDDDGIGSYDETGYACPGGEAWVWEFDIGQLAWARWCAVAGVTVDGPRQDTDADGTPDTLDPDDDGDGIDTAVEGSDDVDGDGTPNYRDLDSDGDGTPDEVEGLGDEDCDGIWNFVDPDDASGDCPIYETPTNAGTGDGDGDGDGAGGTRADSGCGCSGTGRSAPLGAIFLVGLVARRRR